MFSEFFASWCSLELSASVSPFLQERGTVTSNLSLRSVTLSLLSDDGGASHTANTFDSLLHFLRFSCSRFRPHFLVLPCIWHGQSAELIPVGQTVRSFSTPSVTPNNRGCSAASSYRKICSFNVCCLVLRRLSVRVGYKKLICKYVLVTWKLVYQMIANGRD